MILLQVICFIMIFTETRCCIQILLKMVLMDHGEQHQVNQLTISILLLGLLAGAYLQKVLQQIRMP